MSQTMSTSELAFREVLQHLNGIITEENVTALRKSLRVHKLRKGWDREVGSLPTVGDTWSWWLGHLAHASVAVKFLAQAGVLGKDWDRDAQAAAFKGLGWS